MYINQKSNIGLVAIIILAFQSSRAQLLSRPDFEMLSFQFSKFKHPPPPPKFLFGSIHV